MYINKRVQSCVYDLLQLSCHPVFVKKNRTVMSPRWWTFPVCTIHRGPVQRAHSPQRHIELADSRQALSSLHISLTISTLTWPAARAQTHCSDAAAARNRGRNVQSLSLSLPSSLTGREGGEGGGTAPLRHVSPGCNSRRCLLEQMWEEGKSDRLALAGV